MFVVEIMGLKTTQNNKLRVVKVGVYWNLTTMMTMYCNDNN